MTTVTAVASGRSALIVRLPSSTCAPRTECGSGWSPATSRSSVSVGTGRGAGAAAFAIASLGVLASVLRDAGFAAVARLRGGGSLTVSPQQSLDGTERD